MGSGPSIEQKQAAASQAEANRQNSATQQAMLQIWRSTHDEVQPYGESLMTKGLPFLPALLDMKRGITARTNASARAGLLRSIGGFDSAMPNGFKAQLLSDQANSAARNQSGDIINALLMNEQAKQRGTDILTGQQTSANPLGWAGAVTQGNNAIMQAPLQSTSPWATVAGMATGLGSSAMGFLGKPKNPTAGSPMGGGVNSWGW
jgi:hypothetical protein